MTAATVTRLARVQQWDDTGQLVTVQIIRLAPMSAAEYLRSQRWIRWCERNVRIERRIQNSYMFSKVTKISRIRIKRRIQGRKVAAQ